MPKLNLSMPEDDKEAIHRIKKEVSAVSISELVRRAVPVYVRLHRTVRRGGQVILRDPNGREKVLELADLINPYKR